MPAPWTQIVPHIKDGEAVAAGVASRPDRALEVRDNYLKDRIDAAELGEGVLARGVTLDPALLAGQPVAWDPATERFAPALAGVEADPASGALVATDLADCLGILLSKTNATRGDLLLRGRARVDLDNAVDGPATPGRYYLSAASPGKLVRQRPPVSVAVLYYDGAYAYVDAAPRDFLESHVHHRFELSCAPAGVHSDPGAGQVHVIGSPDPGLPGWLPAGHASFGGVAPAGSAFGYNLAAHPELQRVFPPIPIESAVLCWDKADGAEGRLIPLGPDALCVVDRHGLWWMSNCYGDVPWPVDYDSANPPEPLEPGTVPPECPRASAMRLTLGYTEMLFATASSVVTSLAPAPGSSIRVTDCDGQPGTTGSLLLDLDLAFLTDGVDVAGARVFKQLDGTTFRRGYVVEELVAGTNVTLTPTVGTAAAAQGSVRIDVDTDLGERELAPQVVRLDDAKERFHLDVPYLGFPGDRRSAVRLRFHVPSAGLPVNPVVRIRMALYGQSSGTLPVLALTSRRLPRPGSGLQVVLPATDASVTVNTNLAITAGSYREVESSPIAVAAGDTLLVSFVRSQADGYTGEVGLLRIAGVIAGGGVG